MKLETGVGWGICSECRKGDVIKILQEEKNTKWLKLGEGQQEKDGKVAKTWKRMIGKKWQSG